MNVESLKCVNCELALEPGMKKCPACDSPVVITSFNSVYSMSVQELNQNRMGYQKMLQKHPDNPDLHTSIAMCFLKLGMPDKALPEFEKAIENNLDNPENYFYAAVCMLNGKKAFLSQRPIIDKIEEYLQAAIMLEPRGVFYLFWAYIRQDYHERKFLRVSPRYDELAQEAAENNLTPEDHRRLFDELLKVPCPSALEI